MLDLINAAAQIEDAINEQEEKGENMDHSRFGLGYVLWMLCPPQVILT